MYFFNIIHFINIFRTGKPFNPLLGETFECDRMEDLGWRSISEQVNKPNFFCKNTLAVLC